MSNIYLVARASVFEESTQRVIKVLTDRSKDQQMQSDKYQQLSLIYCLHFKITLREKYHSKQKTLPQMHFKQDMLFIYCPLIKLQPSFTCAKREHL